MLLMVIAQSDADQLLRDLNMLEDSALEAADEAVQAPTLPCPTYVENCPKRPNAFYK